MTIDRDKAAAMQINANQIENALYDAYGPRWVSTIYASVNEYKVLLELEPRYQADPERALAAVLQEHRRAAGSARHAGDREHGNRTADHQPLRAASRGHDFVQPEARRVVGRRGDARSRIAADEVLPSGISTQFQGAAKAFQSSLGNLVGAADHRHRGGVHRAGHSVRELHSSDHDSFGAAVGGFRRAGHAGDLFHIDLNIYAFVGLIMLIGIVEKNAIMQIDFALEAERQQGMSAGEGDL